MYVPLFSLLHALGIAFMILKIDEASHCIVILVLNVDETNCARMLIMWWLKCVRVTIRHRCSHTKSLCGPCGQNFSLLLFVMLVFVAVFKDVFVVSDG